MKNNKPSFTQGPIKKTLVQLTLPMIVGMVSMIAFNLIDTYFVSQLGTLELAAMTFTFPVVMIISSMAVGLGIGASSIISRAIGEGNPNKVKRLATDSLLLALALAFLIVMTGIFTIEPLFRLLGAKNDTLPLIKEYMTIWYPGVMFVIIPMVGNNAIRATGDTRAPSAIMLFAVLLNAVLDPLFIFGYKMIPRLELQGAALATVLSRAFTLVFSLWILSKREKLIVYKKIPLKNIWASWKKILYIAAPAAGTSMITPLSMGVVTRILASYGKEVVAGFGVASRIEMFVLSVIMAFSSVLAPFVGQNLGAKKPKRIQIGVLFSHKFAFFWGLGAFLTFLLFSTPIAKWFRTDPKVVSTISTYLFIVSASYAFSGIQMLSASAFNALSKPLLSTHFSALRMLGLYLPLAFLGSYLFEESGVFIGAAVANAIAGAASKWKLHEHLKFINEKTT